MCVFCHKRPHERSTRGIPPIKHPQTPTVGPHGVPLVCVFCHKRPRERPTRGFRLSSARKPPTTRIRRHTPSAQAQRHLRKRPATESGAKRAPRDTPGAKHPQTRTGATPAPTQPRNKGAHEKAAARKEPPLKPYEMGESRRASPMGRLTYAAQHARNHVTPKAPTPAELREQNLREPTENSALAPKIGDTAQGHTAPSRGARHHATTPPRPKRESYASLAKWRLPTCSTLPLTSNAGSTL